MNRHIRCSSLTITTAEMKLLIVLLVIACSYAAKLDRTYLPPATAANAGGSPGSLTAPSGPFGSNTGLSGGFNQASASSGGARPYNFGQTSPQGQANFGKPSGPSGSLNTGFNQGSTQSGGARPNNFGQTSPQGQANFGQPTGPSGSPNAGLGSGGFNQAFPQSGATKPNIFAQSSPQGQANFGQPAGPSGFGQQGSTGQVGLTQGFGQPSGNFGRTQGGVPGSSGFQSQRPQAEADRTAEILRYDNQNDGETFSYSFETSNGISAEESGVATNGVQAQGGYSYTGDDGQVYKITYTADENGYVPQGDHLPTPPPIPEEILRSIEQNARAAAAGTQEGAYNPDEDNQPQNYNAGAPSYQGQGQAPGFSRPQGSQGASFQGAQQPSISRPGSQGTGFNQGSTGQFNQQGNFAPSGQPSFSGRPQASSPSSKSQGDSGYQYNGPQAGQPSQGPGSQTRPQFNQAVQPGSQGAFNKPSSTGTFGSFNSAQGSGSPTGSRPQSGGQPSSFGPSVSNQGPFRPAGPSQGAAGNAPSQGSFGPSSTGQNAFRPSTQSGSTASSGYQYNRPGSQGSGSPSFNSPAGPRVQGGVPQGGRPTQNGFAAQGQAGSRPGQPGTQGSFQGSQGPAFGGPRQPPSFSEKEGYKY